MTETASQISRDDLVVDALATAVSADDLESVTRPILEALHELTGLDSTYLTSIRWDEDVQRIEFSRNAEADFEIPEGLEVPWQDTLCRRAMESGRVYTDDVPDVWGDSEAARDLGIQTYASAPVVLPDGTTYGTLCGASSRTRPPDDRTLELLRVFSRVIADAIAREDELVRVKREAAWAQEQLASRAAFLAEAEHQLKTPLAVIAGWTRMLLEGRVAEDSVPEALRTIDQQAVALGDRMHQLLEQARSEILVSELELRSVPLAAICEEVCTDLRVLSQHHELCSSVPDDVEVLADPRALQVVLEHLVENAIKHTDDGLIRCSVELDEGYALLTIRDSGPGLPDGVDVFAAFTRGSQETRGSGLGLHIVRSLIEAMDGEVTAVRDDAPGAAFLIRLPRVE